MTKVCGYDSLPDGLELGVQNPIPDTVVAGQTVKGTDTTKTFDWTFKTGKTVPVHNYTKDMDPTTLTDPKRADSDGDGIKDGLEEVDVMRLDSLSAPRTLRTTDLNGKRDGFNETSPLDIDSDDDGLADGTEDPDRDGLWTSNQTAAWKFDTDGDGLGDGLECGLTLKDITKDTDTSIFVPDADPSTITDPRFIDSDGDFVPDGWIDGWICDPNQAVDFGKYGVPDGMFQFGEGEDKNLNGMVDQVETNPKSIDTDCDGLLDGWDNVTSGSLVNIFSTTDGSKTRYWGELNYTTHELKYSGSGGSIKQSAPTDPTSIDSDGDGLTDGNRAIGDRPKELDHVHNGIAQNYYTDPSLMDSDDDGLSDGLEVSGWEVHIIKEKTKKEVSNRTVYSNPTIVDGDEDGINDYNEFLNSSDPWEKDTDGDHIEDGDESIGELTQIEGKDPEILKFDDGSEVQFNIKFVFDEYVPIIITKVLLEASVKVGDNAGIDYVTIKLSGQSAKTELVEGAPLETTVTISFDFDWVRSSTIGYDVNITVADVNGNGNCTTTHIDGYVEGRIKAFINSWKSFVDTVTDFLGPILELISSWLELLVNKLFKPVQDFGNSVIWELFDFFFPIIASFENYSGKSKEDLEFRGTLKNLGKLVTIFLGIYIILLSTEIIVLAMSSGLAQAIKIALQTTMKSLITMAILSVITYVVMEVSSPYLSSNSFISDLSSELSSVIPTEFLKPGIFLSLFVVIIAFLKYYIQRNIRAGFAFVLAGVSLCLDVFLAFADILQPEGIHPSQYWIVDLISLGISLISFGLGWWAVRKAKTDPYEKGITALSLYTGYVTMGLAGLSVGINSLSLIASLHNYYYG